MTYFKEEGKIAFLFFMKDFSDCFDRLWGRRDRLPSFSRYFPDRNRVVTSFAVLLCEIAKIFF